jgi:hypothetical protein
MRGGHRRLHSGRASENNRQEPMAMGYRCRRPDLCGPGTAIVIRPAAGLRPARRLRTCHVLRRTCSDSRLRCGSRPCCPSQRRLRGRPGTGCEAVCECAEPADSPGQHSGSHGDSRAGCGVRGVSPAVVPISGDIVVLGLAHYDTSWGRRRALVQAEVVSRSLERPFEEAKGDLGSVDA